jgi:hypothetical protein
MSRYWSGKPDPDLEGAELLFHQKGGSTSFGAKTALSQNETRSETKFAVKFGS